jgi:hypothetical protein
MLARLLLWRPRAAAATVLAVLVVVPAVAVALEAEALPQPGRGPVPPHLTAKYASSHRANACRHRFDEDYVSETRTAGLATTLYDTDPNWYTNSDTTDHITGELDKLTMHDRYNGNDQIHAANGAGMEISRIGKSIVPTPSRNRVLNNVLHVPTVHKNLISVHRFTLNNNTFIEFHPYFFLIKD